MMYRLLYCAILAISVTACNTPILSESQSVEELELAADYYLRFDINNIDYTGPETQDTSYVASEQDLDFRFTLQDVLSLERHLYFAGTHLLPADSIALLGSLRFLQQDGSEALGSTYDLEFVVTEALDNLEANADGTYNYLDRQLLSDHLRNGNWGNTQLFTGHNVNQMLLTLPLAQEPAGGWGDILLTSSGFYFPHETLEITEVTYLTEEDAIVISGTFAVELKILSCGYYSFYSVRQAAFRAIIQ